MPLEVWLTFAAGIGAAASTVVVELEVVAVADGHGRPASGESCDHDDECLTDR